MKSIKVRNILTLTLLGTTICGAAPSSVRFFTNLKNADLDVRSGAYQNAIELKNLQVSELLELVENKPEKVLDNGTWIKCISLLGYYRASEAVPLLVRHLTVLSIRSGIYFSSEPRAIQYSYPCAAALVRIGEPSKLTLTLLNTISSTEQRDERELAAWVLLEVKGRDEVLARLETETAKASGIEKKNLQLATDFIEKYKPVRGALFKKEDGTIERF